MGNEIRKKFIFGIILGIFISVTLLAGFSIVLHIIPFPFVQDPLEEGIFSDIFIHNTVNSKFYFLEGSLGYVNTKKAVVLIKGSLLVVHVTSDTKIVSDTGARQTIDSLKKNQRIICVIKKAGDNYDAILIKSISEKDIKGLANIYQQV